MDKVIVLLHPFPLSSDFWEGLAPVPGYRYITPNFPGFGSSLPEASGYTLAKAAQDLEQYLNFKKLPKPYVLVGISMGGYWAFEYLRQFPDQVEKLVLISTRAGVDKPEGKQGRLDMAKRVEEEGVGFVSEAMTPKLLGKTTLADKPVVKDQVVKWILNATPAGVALAQRAMAVRQDQTDLLPTIQAKTLIVAGEEDALIPSSEAVAMNQAIPGSQLAVMEQVGHLLPIEAPEKFQKLLEEFLAQ